MPPVTPERSPPASRITGADSPVMADSSIEATPSMISPSLGITSPATTSTRSPDLQRRGDGLLDRAVGLAAAGGGCPAGLPQGVGLGLAAGFGDRRGEVGEQQRCHEPEVQGQQVAQAGRAGDAAHLGHGVDERQHGADLDHEHHGVLPLDVRPEHDQRLPEGRLHELRVEEARLAALPPREFEFLRRRAGGLRFKGCCGHRIVGCCEVVG